MAVARAIPKPRGRGSGAPRAGAPGGGLALSLGILALIVLVGSYLRVKNNDYGLPYVYNYDEATHFTNRAVSFFTADFNPGYFQNPSAYTYIVYAVLKLGYGVLGILRRLEEPSVTRQFSFDPTPIWETARTDRRVPGDDRRGRYLGSWAARCGAPRTGVPTTAWAGRRGDPLLRVPVGRLLAHRGHRRGTFLPIAVATWAMLRAYEQGKLWQYALAGAGVGLAIGFKYTAGLAILPVLLIAAVRAFRDRGDPVAEEARRPLVHRRIAAMVVMFAITNPYFFLKPISALYQLKQQAEAAGSLEKLGQEQVGGFQYYIESLGWGFGYAAAFFVLPGAVFEIRRDRVRGIALILFPIALYLYMGSQTRYFGRWLLPMYPVIALLAGVGIVG